MRRHYEVMQTNKPSVGIIRTRSLNTEHFLLSFSLVLLLLRWIIIDSKFLSYYPEQTASTLQC